MTIDRNARYTAVLATSDGTFTIRLLPKVAPIAVNSFVFLARHHFFDQITFHRIIKGFVIQTGDPTGTGTGGPGYTFNDEPVTMPYTRGTVAMANSGKNTNGSQFFVVVTPPGKTAPLQPAYTIFGQVASGMGVVQKIADTPVGQSVTGELSQPLNPVYLKTVTIQEQR
jgi:peptidyl-prolyl cis-trans isomerase B (cyclophilin B)